MKTPKCNRCNVEMKKGQAIVNGYTGINDIDTVMTICPDPRKAILIPCWKCPKCGKSVK